MTRTSDAFRSLPRFGVLACVFSLAACGGQRLTQTGFLTDYSEMRSQPHHEDDAIYVRPGFLSADYRRVIVEPVAWVPAKNAPRRQPDTQAKLEAAFHKVLSKTLAERFVMVADPGPGRDPGPGVLRVRAAITNTRRALWWVNVPVQAAQIALGGTGLGRPSAGGASEEIEVCDARTNARLVEVATYNNGMPWNVVGSYVPFAHARRAFTLASELVRDEIDQGAPAPAVTVRNDAAPVSPAVAIQTMTQR